MQGARGRMQDAGDKKNGIVEHSSFSFPFSCETLAEERLQGALEQVIVLERTWEIERSALQDDNLFQRTLQALFGEGLTAKRK